MVLTIKELEDAQGFKLEPYQVDLVESRHKQIVELWGRKSGKTAGAISRTVIRMFNDQVQGVGLHGGICILSVGNREAKEILRGIADIISRLGVQYVRERDKVREGYAYLSATELKMPNGNRCLVLPAGHDGKNVRPYSFHEMIYDEGDFIKNEVFEATGPCVARYGGTRLLLSTPNPSCDKTTYFAKAYFGSLQGWKRKLIKTKQSKHISKEFLRQEKTANRSAYLREYECAWKAAHRSVYDVDLINSHCADVPLDIDKLWKASDVVYIGVDFARFGKDDNVIAYNFIKGDKGFIAVEVIKGRTRMTEITGRILNLVNNHNVIDKIVTDEAGVGAGPTDALVDELGSFKVIGIQNHKKVEVEGRRAVYQKVDLHTNTVRMLEYDRLVLDDDINIKRSLGNMQYTYGKNGELSIWGNDSHIAEAIVRAVFPMYRPGARWTGEVKIQKIE